jgi:S-adenosylmethionine:tRNA ribosyltransferase-isomerase
MTPVENSHGDAPVSSIDLGFEIPADRIAQRPLEERTASKLLVYRRSDGCIEHRTFRELPCLVPRETLIVLNDSRVVPCRLIMTKSTGGKLDLLLLRWIEYGGAEGLAEVLARGAGSGLRPGAQLHHERIHGSVVGKTGRGSLVLRLRSTVGEGIVDLFHACALMPLPPYIRRIPDEQDTDRYQAVYGRTAGSIAAPTAGLHFTSGLIEAAGRCGIEIAFITLHVGEGTFRPIRTRLLGSHRMHGERFRIDEENARRIAGAMAASRPVLPVGTSCVRALEGVVHETGRFGPWSGSTSLFIRPGYRFRVVSAMVTNFHTPASPPLSLVMALAGIDEIRRIYREALDTGYRFFSYGDSMMIL